MLKLRGNGGWAGERALGRAGRRAAGCGGRGVIVMYHLFFFLFPNGNIAISSSSLCCDVRSELNSTFSCIALFNSEVLWFCLYRVPWEWLWSEE
jgi:hypothetical protein